MEIEEAFVSHLITNAQLWVDTEIWVDIKLWNEETSDLYALISSRLFPEEIPQGTNLPAVSYIKISDVKEHTLAGQLELERPVFQFSVFAHTKAVARQVSNKLKAVMADFVGTMSGIEIQKIELQTEMSGLEKSSDGTIRIFTEDLEFQISYIRS